MAVAGIMQTTLRALSLWMKQGGWPFYRIQCISVAALGLALVAYLAISVSLGLVTLPRWHFAKWVFLRGACTGFVSLLSLVAVQFGAPLGDVAALGSLNTVAAAVLGRLFLGEELRRAHVVGLACAVAGAAMIGLGGHGSLSARAWFGLPLAALSGLAQGFQFVFARKSKGVPAPVLSCSGSFMLFFMTMTAVVTGIVDDASLTPVLEDPWQAVLWLASLVAVTLVITMTSAVGAQLCPAAMSATVTTGVGMVSSYVVQASLFGAEVGPLSLFGAALMLASMLFMTCSRVPPAAPEAPAPAPGLRLQQAVADGELDGDDSESLHSFASFVSAEFAAASPASFAAQLRVRRAATAPANPPCRTTARTFGAAVAGVSIASSIAV